MCGEEVMSTSNVANYPQLLKTLGTEQKIVYLCGAGASMSLADHGMSWPNWILAGKDYLRYLKENPKGVAEMCKVMDEVRVETEDRTWITAIRNLMTKLKISVQEAMENLDVPTEKRDKYEKLINMKVAR